MSSRSPNNVFLHIVAQVCQLVRSREEHEAILNAIAQGDGDEASRRMRAHMLNAASAIGRYISMQIKKEA